MLYMLDTDMVIYMSRFVRGRSTKKNQEIGKKIIGKAVKISSKHEIVVSAITISEYFIGTMASDDPTKAQDIFMKMIMRPFELKAYDDACAEAYGKLANELRSTGKTIGPNDMFIAAHALTLGATLVTNNVREFKRVKGLKIENWSKT